VYATFLGSDLHHQVGKPAEPGCWEADGVAGTLFYGPYLPLQPGRYYARLKLYKLASAQDSAQFWLDVASHDGVKTHLDLQMQCKNISNDATAIFLEFSLDEAAMVEVRARVTEESLIGVRELIVFRKDA
jgi:hypothetical protein